MTKKTFIPAMDCTSQERQPIELIPVQSSQIKAIGYSAETKTLAITFTRGPGNVYEYPGVEPETHAAFIGAESLGVYFGQHIQCLPSNKFKPDAVVTEQPASTETTEAA